MMKLHDGQMPGAQGMSGDMPDIPESTENPTIDEID